MNTENSLDGESETPRSIHEYAERTKNNQEKINRTYNEK